MPTRQELLELEELAALEARMNPTPEKPKTVTEKMSSAVDDAVETVKNIGGFGLQTARKMGASGLRGYEGLAKTFENLPGTPSLMMKAFRKATENPREKALNAIDVPDDSMAGTAEQFFNKAVRGAGGQLAFPVPGAGVLPNVLPGAAGGLTGEAARRYAEGISPKLAPVAELLGNVAGGGATGFALGPKLKLSEVDIHDALKNYKGKDFADARIKSARQTASGAKTNTAAEAFPENSAILDVADKARSGNVDNALRQRLEGRPQDLQDLGTEFLNRITKPVDPNTVANKVGDAATNAQLNLKDLRNTGIENRLAKIKPIRPDIIKNIQDDLLYHAKTVNRPGEAEAFRTVANALQGQNGKLTNVQELSLAIVELRKTASNPNSQIYQSGSVSKRDMEAAIEQVRNKITNERADFGQALNDFEDFSKGPMANTRTGPVGALADKNPLVAGQTPVARLEGLLAGNSPKTIKGTARTLNTPILTRGANVDPAEIARAIGQNRLKLGPTNPGQAVRGNQGSDAEANFNALLEAAGKNPNQVNAPLQTADELQRLSGPSGIQNLPKMTMGQMLIRPFRTLDMALTSGRIEKVNAETARLLADPANLPELQRIAMFNPMLRKALSVRGVIVPAMGEEK